MPIKRINLLNISEFLKIRANKTPTTSYSSASNEEASSLVATDRTISWDVFHLIEDLSQDFIVRFLRKLEDEGAIELFEIPEDWDEIPDLYDFLEDLVHRFEFGLPE